MDEESGRPAPWTTVRTVWRCRFCGGTFDSFEEIESHLKEVHHWTSLGKGILSWPNKERVGDRYGLVGLWTQPDIPRPKTGKEMYHYSKLQRNVKLIRIKEGKYGRLIVIVLKTQRSLHIGDLYRGFFPSTPEVAEIIVLGKGYVFYEEDCVGLEPKEPRQKDWLDPRKLYRAHDQYVELFFEEVNAG